MEKISKTKNKIETSIEEAINFLYQNQLNYGEFKTLASWNPWMLTSYFDSSPFATTFVLYSLRGLEDEKVKVMTKKALDFLLSEQEPGGIWRFWTSRNKKRLPPDLDDISTISFILKLNGVSFDDNLKLILNNRNERNLFLTWIMEENEKYNFAWLINKKDIDCAVNTNVLLYLGKNDPFVCSYINQIIKTNQFSSIYYPSQLDFYYLISRAFRHNITCFGENKEKIIKSTLNYQKRNGSFGNCLETALALNTLFNFSYDGKEIDLGINYLLQKQSINGSWEKGVLFLGPWPYRYYGSEELTTALCIESLKNYR